MRGTEIVELGIYNLCRLWAVGLFGLASFTSRRTVSLYRWGVISIRDVRVALSAATLLQRLAVTSLFGPKGRRQRNSKKWVVDR